MSSIESKVADGPPVGPAKRRLRRPSLGNEELLDRVFELFVEVGFERASVDVISTTIGIAKRTLYARYGDKEGLFKAAVERAIDQWIVPVESLRAVEQEDLGETMLAIGRMLVDNALSLEGLRLLQLTNAVSAQIPEIGDHNIQKSIKPTVTYLAELFRRRIGPGLPYFTGAEGAALAFLNLVVGPASLVAWGVPLHRKFIDGYVDASVSLFVHGLLPHAGDASFAALSHENQRLKLMLAEAMVELDSARQQANPGADSLSVAQVLGGDGLRPSGRRPK